MIPSTRSSRKADAATRVRGFAAFRRGQARPTAAALRRVRPEPRGVFEDLLAFSTNEAGTSTSLGPAARKSRASKPGARWISEGMLASFSTPSISSATDSSGAAATFTQLSAMHASYPRLFTEARGRRVLGSLYPGSCIELEVVLSVACIRIPERACSASLWPYTKTSSFRGCAITSLRAKVQTDLATEGEGYR
jgi:hypothetical protein